MVTFKNIFKIFGCLNTLAFVFCLPPNSCAYASQLVTENQVQPLIALEEGSLKKSEVAQSAPSLQEKFKQKCRQWLTYVAPIVTQKRVVISALVVGSLLAGGIVARTFMQSRVSTDILDGRSHSNNLGKEGFFAHDERRQIPENAAQGEKLEKPVTTDVSDQSDQDQFERLLDVVPRPNVFQAGDSNNCDGAVCPNEIAMVTISTPNRAEFASITEENQKKFAQRHGYQFVKYTSSLCIDRPEEWSKVLAMAKQSENNGIKWLLWIDDDIVITDKSKKIEQLINQYGNDKNLIVAQDADRNRTPINNGIFLLRNSAWGRQFLSEVWDEGRRRNYLERGKCLLEQQTMADLIKENPIYRDRVVIVPQRTMNSFVRSPFMYPNDPDDSRWQFGDFAAHATGWNGDHENRRRVIELLASQQCQSGPDDVSWKMRQCLKELEQRARVGH